jgi:nucleotide-binding universal stress UspA family protein
MTSVAPKPTPRTVILTAIDGTSVSQDAAAAAARFSALPGSELHFVHVLGSLTGKPDQAALDKARTLLEGTAQVVGVGERVTLHVAVGKPWREIVQLAADLRADLVVVGTHGRGAVGRMVLGSVAEQVVRSAGCPVHVARAKFYEQNGPEIEPPCAECALTQEKSRGETLWCAQHSGRHVHGKLHYELPQGFGAGNTFLRP